MKSKSPCEHLLIDVRTYTNYINTEVCPFCEILIGVSREGTSGRDMLQGQITHTEGALAELCPL